MEGKLYIADCCANYENGDYSEYSSWVIGVYSSLVLAEQAGLNELQKLFKWDEEGKKFYSSSADEAWVEIRECAIDEVCDLSKPPVKCIPEQANA